MVEVACTWAHPLRPSGCQEAADRGSAQALVQVGRGEEGIGGQAHGQEAPDHGGAKTTFQEKNRETSELSAVGLSPPAPGTERHGDEPCLLLESMLPPGMPGQRSLGSWLRGSGGGVRRVSAVQLPQGPGRRLLSSGLSL